VFENSKTSREQGHVNLNFAIGEPFFLHRYIKIPSNIVPSRTYPPNGGNKALLEQLVEIYPGYHIVVTNGARQALGAVMYEVRQNKNGARMYAPVPHWGGFRSTAVRAGISLHSLRRCPDVIPTGPNVYPLITYPNNPSGLTCMGFDQIPEDNRMIWDGAYALGAYGDYWGLSKMHLDQAWCSIFSASKLFGISGLRVGWAVTKDLNLYKRLRRTVEAQTCGVSTYAQDVVASLLRSYPVSFQEKNRTFREANESLRIYARYCKSAIGHMCEEFSVSGMFAWFKIYPELQLKFKDKLVRHRIKLAPGTDFGVEEEGWWRMSLGHKGINIVHALQCLSLKE